MPPPKTPPSRTPAFRAGPPPEHPPKSLVGLSAPLFEKLVDFHPNPDNDPKRFGGPGVDVDDQDLRFQTRDAVIGSIRREVSRIIDTRIPWPSEAERPDRDGPEREVDLDATSIGFGVPDMTHLCVRSTADRRQIERLVTTAIRSFEPRLENPSVTVLVSAGGLGAAFEISGSVRLGRSLEPLVFEVAAGVQVGARARRDAAGG